MEYAALLLLASLARPAPAGLEVRFIGNSAFEVSDGSATLLTDLPYESGAFGYMQFDRRELRARDTSLCLFTHGHADHFDPSMLDEVGCSVAGPHEVISAAGGRADLGGGPSWHFGGATVECIPSDHGGVPHCSFLIEWHGKRLFFSGDIDTLDALLGVQPPLDAVFLPAWLASASPRARAKFPTARIVIHHHRTGEDLPDCGGCVVPEQGSTFTIPHAPPDATAGGDRSGRSPGSTPR
jgi:L-ascorbate metabolism protein UlaG (beta-lactamase superfamily)